MQQGIQISSTVLPRLLFASFPVVCSEQFCLLRLYSSVAQFAWSIVCLIFWSFCNASGTTTFEDRLKQAKGQTDFYWQTKISEQLNLNRCILQPWRRSVAKHGNCRFESTARLVDKTRKNDNQCVKWSNCRAPIDWPLCLLDHLLYFMESFVGGFAVQCVPFGARDSWTTSKTHKVELITIRHRSGLVNE